MWDENKVNQLKQLWGSGKTASQIAEIIGGLSRNAIIGKAHRLNLSAKIRTKKFSNVTNNQENNNSKIVNKKNRKNKFKSLLIQKNFEPAKNLTLEELTDETCKYMDAHPNEEDATFCGRKNVNKFSYCPLHLMIVFNPKGKKDDSDDKENEAPQYIDKKIKLA